MSRSMIELSNLSDKQLVKLSIQHWKNMLKLTITNIKDNREAPNVTNCPLCEVYGHYRSCNACPVRNKSGRIRCLSTPYMDAADLYYEIQRGDHRRLGGFRTAVRTEIEFLESLDV